MSRDGWENRDKRHCPRVYTVIPEKILAGIRLPSYLLRPSQLYVRTEGLLYSSLTTFKSSSKAKQRYISGKRCSRHSWFIVSETKHDFFIRVVRRVQKIAWESVQFFGFWLVLDRAIVETVEMDYIIFSSLQIVSFSGRNSLLP